MAFVAEGQASRPNDGDEEDLLLSDSEDPLRRRWYIPLRRIAFMVACGLTAAFLIAWLRARGHQHVDRSAMFETSEGQMPLMQKWLPTEQSDVLPYDQWVKQWHVKVGHLTDVVYHTYSHHPTFVKEQTAETAFLKWQMGHNCPRQVVGFDIVSQDVHQFPALSDVTSPGDCQKRCTETTDCDGWTWSKVGAWKHHCWRKKNKKGEYRFSGNADVVSGRACDHQWHDFWWPETDADLYNLPMPAKEAPQFRGLTCAIVPSKKECHSPMKREFLPWPLSQLEPQKTKKLDCCAPIESQKAPSCSSGKPVRTGEACSGFEAAKFGCCPHEFVSGSNFAALHCIVLFRAFTYEQELLELQYSRNAGVFSCDSYALYSNQLVEIKPGVVTRRVSSAMMAEMGGMFITALNLGIFLALYRQVILDAEFMSASWIVKVDPDTVWSPQRLRPVLKEMSWGVMGDGIYLNNCHDGLHGPIEIFSSSAFYALGENAKSCADHMDKEECTEHCEGVWSQTKVCNGPCTQWWGEDIWADQCLHRFTKAKRVLIKTVLQEAHCKPHIPDWSSCDDPNTVAFHPFKSPEEFENCLNHMNFHTSFTDFHRI